MITPTILILSKKITPRTKITSNVENRKSINFIFFKKIGLKNAIDNRKNKLEIEKKVIAEKIPELGRSNRISSRKLISTLEKTRDWKILSRDENLTEEKSAIIETESRKNDIPYTLLGNKSKTRIRVLLGRKVVEKTMNTKKKTTVQRIEK